MGSGTEYYEEKKNLRGSIKQYLLENNMDSDGTVKAEHFEHTENWVRGWESWWEKERYWKIKNMYFQICI